MGADIEEHKPDSHADAGEKFCAPGYGSFFAPAPECVAKARVLEQPALPGGRGSREASSGEDEEYRRGHHRQHGADNSQSHKQTSETEVEVAPHLSHVAPLRGTPQVTVSGCEAGAVLGSGIINSPNALSGDGDRRDTGRWQWGRAQQGVECALQLRLMIEVVDVAVKGVLDLEKEAVALARGEACCRMMRASMRWCAAAVAFLRRCRRPVGASAIASPVI